MTYLRWSPFLIVLSLGVAACVSSSQTSTPGVSADKIVVSELPSSEKSQTVYDLVSQKNPSWLQKRGPTSYGNSNTDERAPEGQEENNPIQVYVDRSKSPFGTAESLKKIQVNEVSVIEYFDAQKAQFQFGAGNVSGAILVKRKGSDE